MNIKRVQVTHRCTYANFTTTQVQERQQQDPHGDGPQGQQRREKLLHDDDDDSICDEGSNTAWDCVASSMGSDICPQSSLSFTSSMTSDADQDGCEDRNEDEDDDNDGFLDKHDDCPNDAGTSNNGRLFGCPDADGDGYADSIDSFPSTPSQWADTDEDGYGDSPTGLNGDQCPGVYGTSTEDRLGCTDSDGDGWSNPSSLWGIDSGADAFEQDASQHADADGDGHVAGGEPGAEGRGRGRRAAAGG